MSVNATESTERSLNAQTNFLQKGNEGNEAELWAAVAKLERRITITAFILGVEVGAGLCFLIRFLRRFW